MSRLNWAENGSSQNRELVGWAMLEKFVDCKHNWDPTPIPVLPWVLFSIESTVKRDT